MALVTPNKLYFEELCRRGEKRESVARKLGISVGIFRKCLRGKDVSPGIIEHIAQTQRCPASSLIVRRLDTVIPDDPKFFESLKFGWWIDNDRRLAGTPLWFTESIELKSVPGMKKQAHPCFTGHIFNQLKQAFRVTAERLNNHHFSLTAVSKTDETTWHGCLTVRKGGVLCGTWSGYPGHLVPCVSIYRYFMSESPLTIANLQQLTRDVKIECYSEADAFAYDTLGDRG